MRTDCKKALQQGEIERARTGENAHKPGFGGAAD